MAGAAAYRISRAVNQAGPFVAIGSVPLSASYFADAGLIPNTTFFYQIEAIGPQPVMTALSRQSATAPVAPPVLVTMISAVATCTENGALGDGTRRPVAGGRPEQRDGRPRIRQCATSRTLNFALPKEAFGVSVSILAGTGVSGT